MWGLNISTQKEEKLAEDAKESRGTDSMQITPGSGHQCWPGRKEGEKTWFHMA